VDGICVGCGMCCDGTMYRTVNVRADDRIEILEAAGLVFSTADDLTSFRQPCSAFGDGCCSVYADRPSGCRSYRCLLLRRFEAGEVSRETARALIARTIEMRDRVRSGLTECVGIEDRKSLDVLYRLMMAKFEAAPDPAAARREHSDLLLTVAALRVVLAREFEPRDSKSHQPDEAAEATTP
jgi:Fe-S-cluster containining protein